jgi:hypothetical protein
VSFVLLQWKEGLTVILADDVGGHRVSGSGSTASPVWTERGSASSADGRGYTWQLESADGRTANLTIDGKAYDPSRGGLFVVRTKGGRTEVHQLVRDLSAVPSDPGGCREYLKKDGEVMKLLADDGQPK